MANELQELLNEVADGRLKARLSAAVGELRKTKKFGLVFEEHIPELLPIYSAKIRVQARVARKDGRLTETYIVQSVAKGIATVTLEQGDGKSKNIPVGELVLVKRFGEAIFPALRLVTSVLRGGNAPHHTLIEADNYHALQLLDWLYVGKVDCIYIDPPYNTGARDWKYNNSYVDKNDSYRHSKWLSMMKKRLVLAQRLLKADGVLIVTIDRNEAQHLNLLLEELLPNASIQPVTICINPSGSSGEGLSRVEEYAFFCFLGGSEPNPVVDDMLTEGLEKRAASIRWEALMRGGNAWYRKSRENLCYPVILNKNADRIVGVGSPMAFHDDPKRDLEEEKRRPLTKDGKPLAWPVRNDGKLGIWRVDGARLMSLTKEGFAYVSSRDEKRGTWTIRYLMEGTVKAIAEGKIVREGVGPSGEALLRRIEDRRLIAKTVWNRGRHTAGGGAGTGLVSEILDRKDAFPFPKSVYAVRDCIDVAIGSRKDALIVDFFAGSGTTLNAISLMNALDGGNRQCILITNNEVHPEARAKELTLAGNGPGDSEYERHGICQAVTFPRCKFAINGQRDDGSDLPGEYLAGKFEEQVVRRSIRTLDFSSVEALASKKAREALALAVGFTKSKVTGEESFLLGEGEEVAVLLESERLDEFIAQGEEWADAIETVYLPFQSVKSFNEAKGQLADTWPPLVRSVEIKRPMKDGFAANLDYLRLDFLDRSHVETGGKLSDILPALWMMAGCRGKLPTCKGSEKILFFTDCPFAMLVEESAIKLFLARLAERPEVDWVFIVTNDQDSFARMCEWLPEHIPASQRIHLWRNYVDNFLINVDRAAGESL